MVKGGGVGADKNRIAGSRQLHDDIQSAEYSMA